MKKSTILILFIVFLGSVLVVGLFGMRSVPYEERVYIKEIYFTSITTTLKDPNYQGDLLSRVEVNELTGQQEIYLPYEEGLEIIIGFNITPADATNKHIDISIVYPEDYDPDDPNRIVELGEHNEIRFFGIGSVRIQYRSTDQATSTAVVDIWINVLPAEYL